MSTLPSRSTTLALIHSGRHSAASLAMNTTIVRMASRCGIGKQGFERHGRFCHPELGLAVVVLEEVDPQPHPQRQVLALREHRVDAVGRRGELGQHFGPAGRRRSRSPPPRCCARRCPSPARHQSCSTWPSEQSSGPPGLRWTTSPPSALRARERPSRASARRRWTASGSRSCASSLGCCGVPWRCRYCGRGHAQAAVVGQAHAHQRRIGQVAHAHRAVVAFARQVDHAVAQVQRDRHVGMQFAELAAPAAPRGAGRNRPAR